MSAVCIIPARGGSKRIPRKNIRSFHGRPILAYPISAALASGCFDEVMVSTDDQEIADVARECGATVPFVRSTRNSGDHAGCEEAIHEVLEAYRSFGRNFEFACALFPTAALTTPAHLTRGLVALRAEPALTTVLSIVRFGYPVQRALVLRDGRLPMMHPEHYDSRSQDLEPAFHDAGQWYWLRVAPFLRTKEMMGPNSTGVILSAHEVQDIDTEEDWELAEAKFHTRQKSVAA